MVSVFERWASETRAALAAAVEGGLERSVERTIDLLVDALGARLPVLVCGNGGSAADASHIAGELAGRFLLDRPGLPVIALTTDPAVITAWSNDHSFDTVFARQVEALGRAGGVVWGISTSGNSPNVVAALEAAKRVGMTAVAMTGEGGGRLAPLADVLIAAPSRVTAHVQEVHLCAYHVVCAEVERRLFGSGNAEP